MYFLGARGRGPGPLLAPPGRGAGGSARDTEAEQEQGKTVVAQTSPDNPDSSPDSFTLTVKGGCWEPYIKYIE